LNYGDLLLGGYNASLINAKGTVQVTLLGDLAGISPFPVIETALVLKRPGQGLDLDFTLDRGRVDIVNKKKAAPARVRVQVQKESLEVVLKEPETRVALELYGRWPRGVPFKR